MMLAWESVGVTRGAEEAIMAFRFPNTDAEDKIRPEVRALAERGDVTLDEWDSFRGNSWEFELIMPRLTDEALLHCGKTLVGNCVYDNSRPYGSYNEAVMGFLAPELMKRLRAANEREAQALKALCEVSRELDPDSGPR